VLGQTLGLQYVLVLQEFRQNIKSRRRTNLPLIVRTRMTSGGLGIVPMPRSQAAVSEDLLPNLFRPYRRKCGQWQYANYSVMSRRSRGRHMCNGRLSPEVGRSRGGGTRLKGLGKLVCLMYSCILETCPTKGRSCQGGRESLTNFESRRCMNLVPAKHRAPTN
jgi:hypothetical protein